MKKSLTAVLLGMALVLGIAIGVFLEKRWGADNLMPGKVDDVLPISDSPGIPLEYQGKLKLFILAGQSNMVGYGGIDRGRDVTNHRIYLFGNDYRWKTAAEPLDDPRGQVDAVSRDGFAGVGPGMAFASSLLEREPEMVIGLIPCAMGGTFLKEWGRSLSEDTLYGSCVKRALAASAMGEIAGVLFFQGEWDALGLDIYPERRNSPQNWEEDFTALVGDLRRDLKLAELPVVFAQIGQNGNPGRYKNWELVQNEQQQVRLPYCAMITTDDLSLADEVHFTNRSYDVIGQRMAAAYWNLTHE